MLALPIQRSQPRHFVDPHVGTTPPCNVWLYMDVFPCLDALEKRVWHGLRSCVQCQMFFFVALTKNYNCRCKLIVLLIYGPGVKENVPLSGPRHSTLFPHGPIKWIKLFPHGPFKWVTLFPHGPVKLVKLCTHGPVKWLKLFLHGPVKWVKLFLHGPVKLVNVFPHGPVNWVNVCPHVPIKWVKFCPHGPVKW